MKKYILELKVISNTHLHNNYVLLKLTHENPLPEMLPGQFAEIKIEGSSTTFLRRPISINYMNKATNEIWFLIQQVGNGTKQLARIKTGDYINAVLPLGKPFSKPKNHSEKLLLVGGGVGIAPMLYLGKYLKEKGYSPNFLLGAKSQNDLLQLDEFEKYGKVYITTEDGSYGERGFVTYHSILNEEQPDRIYSCGPKPMMISIAQYAKNRKIECEVSLENKMACGIGACLCCVENTQEGHLCVCKDGPVFNIKDLLWQI